MSKRDISRREFLRGSAMGALGLAGVGMLGPIGSVVMAKAEEKNMAAIDWADAADVIVVGGGGAGFCAAIEAGRAGASVIILEKAAMCGGDTAISEGMIMAAGTPEQAELANFTTDTPQKFADQQVAYAQGFADEDMIREMCLESPEHVRFMRDLGRVYQEVEIIPPAWEFDTEDSWGYRCHLNRADKTGHFDALKAEVDRLSNVKVLTEKPGAHLIKDDKHGIIGVTTKDGCHYRSNKGVIMATGSIGTDKEMARKYNRLHYWILTMSEKMGTAPFATPNVNGEGIRMAMEVGADTALCESSVTSNMLEFGGVGSGYINPLMGIDYKNEYNSSPIPGRILINSNARRFVQEDALWGYVNKAIYSEAIRCNWTPDTEQKIWAIQDSYWAQYDCFAQMSMGHPLTKKADTLEELAEMIHVPAENLKDTVARWNRYCEQGKDMEFGRRIDMKPISQPPFYAYPSQPLNSGSFGGVNTDADGRVLDVNGQAIPRLYAAGTTMSGKWCGQFYASCGWAILGTVHWGRKAGRKIVELEPWATDVITPKTGVNDEKVVGNGNYIPGTYTAAAKGFGGDVMVTTVFSETEIVSVKVGENAETPAIGGAAIDLLCERIVNRQSAEIDAISGATITSKAVLEAVQNCIAQASK